MIIIKKIKKKRITQARLMMNSIIFFQILFFAIIANTASAAGTVSTCCKCVSADKPDQKICLTTDAGDSTSEAACTGIPSGGNQATKNLTCTLLAPAACKLISSGDLQAKCNEGPAAASTYTGAAAGSQIPFTEVTSDTFKPNVEIPGLNYSAPILSGGILTVSFIAQYIQAVYNFSIGVAIIAAAIMIVYGGFRYIVGASLGDVTRGKAIVFDAIIGLLLVLGMVTILNTINPATTTLKGLQVQTVSLDKVPLDDKTMDAMHDAATEEGYTPSESTVDVLKQLKGLNSKFTSGGNLTSVGLNKEARKAVTKKIAELSGYSDDPCIIYALIEKESTWQVNLIGHDENHIIPGYVVPARTAFLKTGTKLHGDPFTVADYQIVQNNDVLNTTPPDYGLDWRPGLSHGIGLTQITLFAKGYPKAPASICPPGSDHEGEWGVTLSTDRTKCYTVPMLLTAEGHIEYAGARLKSLKKGGYKTACQVFHGWGGGMSTTEPLCDGQFFKNKMDVYANCRSRGYLQ